MSGLSYSALYSPSWPLSIWLPVEPGWAITIGRAMGPAILVLIGIDCCLRRAGRRPHGAEAPLPAEPLRETEHLVDDVDHAVAGDDVGLDDDGVTDHDRLALDGDR